MWRQRLFNEFGLSDDGNRDKVSDWLNELEKTDIILRIDWIVFGPDRNLLVMAETQTVNPPGSVMSSFVLENTKMAS